MNRAAVQEECTVAGAVQVVFEGCPPSWLPAPCQGPRSSGRLYCPQSCPLRPCPFLHDTDMDSLSAALQTGWGLSPPGHQLKPSPGWDSQVVLVPTGWPMPEGPVAVRLCRRPGAAVLWPCRTAHRGEEWKTWLIQCLLGQHLPYR